MKVQIEPISPVKMKLSISLPEEAVLREFEGAYGELAKRAQVPGFRKGKAPRDVLQKMYGPSVESQVYENLVRDSMVKALTDYKLDAVAMPEISEPKRQTGSGFSYIASVEVKPKFEPKNYKGVKVKKMDTEPKEDQVSDVLKRIQDSHGVLKEREGATKPIKGDFVSLLVQAIDAEGNLTAPDAEVKEQIYEVGSEALHPTVEAAVLKLGKGESTPVTVGGDKEGAPEAHARVTLKAIKEKILPSLDDEFAKSTGPFENLLELKKKIKEDLQAELDQNSRADMVEQILKFLVKDNSVELPESLVDHEIHQMIHGFYSQMERAGVKEIPAEYSEDKLHDKFKVDAQRRVHEQLLIEAVADQEGFAVTEDELSQRLATLAKSAKVPVGEFRSFYEKSNRMGALRFQILAQKTLDFLLANANIK